MFLQFTLCSSKSGHKIPLQSFNCGMSRLLCWCMMVDLLLATRCDVLGASGRPSGRRMDRSAGRRLCAALPQFATDGSDAVLSRRLLHRLGAISRSFPSSGWQEDFGRSCIHLANLPGG